MVDHLASQGSLAYDREQRLASMPSTPGATPCRSSRSEATGWPWTGGELGREFPVSVAVHGNLVYVLNAEGGGASRATVAAFGHLFPLPGSNRNLGLTIPTDTTQFTHTPGQVAFSPDGSQLIVTTKANTNAIDVFQVGFFGLPRPPRW